jgi:hypothetical protein
MGIRRVSEYLRSRSSLGNPLDPTVESTSLHLFADERPCDQLLRLLSRALRVYTMCAICFLLRSVLLFVDVHFLLRLALCFRITCTARFICSFFFCRFLVARAVLDQR